METRNETNSLKTSRNCIISINESDEEDSGVTIDLTEDIDPDSSVHEVDISEVSEAGKETALGPFSLGSPLISNIFINDETDDEHFGHIIDLSEDLDLETSVKDVSEARSESVSDLFSLQDTHNSVIENIEDPIDLSKEFDLDDLIRKCLRYVSFIKNCK